MVKKILLMVMLCALLLPVRVDAAGSVSAENSNVPEYEITRSDELETRYRINELGVAQYRRWNKTRECWYDPDWIDI